MDGSREPNGSGGVRAAEAETPRREARELLERIRAGDSDAFEAVAKEHAPRLFRLARRLCGRREDAEDLVQETLVRTLPKLRGFEGRAQLSTYLVRALTNLWKNQLRSRKRSRLVEWFRGGQADRDGNPGLPVAVDDSPSPLDELERGDRASLVRAAVTRLEPGRRLTLLLREVEELSYEEIASMTGVPVGTVRSRLARARDDLRRLLGDQV